MISSPLLSRPDWTAAVERYVSALTIEAIRHEAAASDVFSLNARRRNGIRETPGVRIYWTLVARGADGTDVSYWANFSHFAQFKTKKAALAEAENEVGTIDGFLRESFWDAVDFLRDNGGTLDAPVAAVLRLAVPPA